MTAPTNAPRSVALVEWTWAGHHPSYFVAFTRALLELGCEVLALAPEPGAVSDALVSLPQTDRARLTVRPFRLADPVPLLVRRFDRRTQMWRTMRQLRREMNRWEEAKKLRADLVFFACIYDFQFSVFPMAERSLRCRWSGLYLHSRAFRKPGSVIPQTGERPCPEKFLRSSRLVAVGTLDEGTSEALEKLSGKPAIIFPDITGERAPAPENPIAQRLRQFANGRRVVGALGHLQPTKGIATFAAIATDPAFADLCFVLAGDVMWHLFSPAEAALLRELADRGNVFTHYEAVPDEAIFNAIVVQCDVLFAAYLDFPNSSNILTKAALLRKPVVVSDGYLMAERVRHYRLGEVVPEADVRAAGEALRRIAADPAGWVERNEPRWAEYHAAHSYPRMKEAFAKLLRCI